MTHEEANIGNRLREIIARLSERGGDAEVDVKSAGLVGELERVVGETLSALSVERDSLSRRVQQLDNLVEQRTKSLTEEISVRKKVEGQLRASHRRYQTMVEAITDYVVAMHVENGRPVGTTHGPGCVAVTGYTAEEFRDQPYLWIDMVPEEDRPFVRARTAQTVEERNAEPFEHRIVTKSGQVRWVRHTSVLQLGNHGEVLACDSLIQDVTARKLAELHLQASEEQKSLALHGGDLGTWDWNVTTGHIEFNRRWAEMLGYTLEELEPHVKTWKRLIHPADRAEVENALTRHWHGETGAYEVQHRLRHGSGDWVWVLAKGRVISRDHEGRPRRACGTHLDITERKQTEEQLQITQFSVDKAPEMVIWLEANAEIHYVNEAACHLLGYSAEEMVGKRVWAFCPEWPAHRYLSDLERLAASGPLNFDMNFCHNDGTAIPVEVTVNELKYGCGWSYYCVSGRDIRERMRTMAALREARTKAEAATRAKTEFLATMSHEIRTPLTAILGYADALQHFGEIKNAPRRRLEMLSAIRRNGNHLIDLISDLLDLSRIEVDHLELTVTPTSPLTLVQEVSANMLERAQSKGLTLGVECSTPIPREFYVDPKRFRQVLTNLVGNAIKFTDAGYVKIGLETRDVDADTACLAVSVKDTGSGIPREKQASIFEPFTHGHDRQVRHTAGTGLGLAICRRLVAASGGEISLSSEKDKGSEFTFTIPLPPRSAMWRPDAGTLSINQMADTKRDIPQVNLVDQRILVVEDTPDTQDLLKLFLEETGASVSVVANGLEGVESALDATRRGTPFSLILMDMRIPELDGHAATRRLRDAGLDCPIIALTAHAMKEDEQACLDAGCDAYATKPVDLCVLFTIVGRLLPEARHGGSDEPRPDKLPPAADQRGAQELNQTAAPRFRPLMRKFMARLPGMLSELQAAREEGESETLFTIVHRLRGTAGNFGFPQITAVANECETALRGRPVAGQELDRSLDQLITLVDMAIESYQSAEQD